MYKACCEHDANTIDVAVTTLAGTSVVELQMDKSCTVSKLKAVVDHELHLRSLKLGQLVANGKILQDLDTLEDLCSDSHIACTAVTSAVECYLRGQASLESMGCEIDVSIEIALFADSRRFHAHESMQCGRKDEDHVWVGTWKRGDGCDCYELKIEGKSVCRDDGKMVGNTSYEQLDLDAAVQTFRPSAAQWHVAKYYRGFLNWEIPPDRLELMTLDHFR